MPSNWDFKFYIICTCFQGLISCNIFSVPMEYNEMCKIIYRYPFCPDQNYIIIIIIVLLFAVHVGEVTVSCIFARKILKQITEAYKYVSKLNWAIYAKQSPQALAVYTCYLRNIKQIVLIMHNKRDQRVTTQYTHVKISLI